MKKLLIITAILLIICMMPFSLFGCDDSEKPSENAGDATDASKLLDGTSAASGTGTEKGSEKGTEKSTDKATENTDDATVVKDRVIKIKDSIDSFKTLGRTSTTSTGLACDFVGSGVEFKGVMKGSVSIKIKAIQNDTGCPAYFTFYVDGVRQDTRHMINCTNSGTTKTLEIANFDKQGEHTIKIVKQSEAMHNLAELLEVRLTGYLKERPADKEYYIEVIGDSLTCGLGNLADTSVTSAGSLWSDGTKSYGYMLAEKLGADYSIVSESGVAVSVGTNGFRGHQMSDLYDKASIFRNKTAKHVQTKRIPDVIVINLGTNDSGFNSAYNTEWCTVPHFKTEMEALINQVRGSYGAAGADIPIVWASKFVGIRQQYVDAIKEVLNTMGGEGAGLYYVEVTPNTAGGQAHPTVAGHTTACNELYDFIVTKKRIIS